MSNPFENIMQKVKDAQSNFKLAQEELKELKVTAEAGAGMVKIELNGNGNAISVDIDDSIYKEDKQVLQGLLAAAINDGVEKIKRLKAEKMQSMAQKLGLPPNFEFPQA